ncbi:epoxyqueuosine reductase [Granulicella pectinivorans]|uniref:Epoxyqueuosine reductase n=1 Tax=Granulicella pectinivorans TaxID=474950 RepID=A0A1I6M4D7_9BACT|nr:epoxyqueuosine reductase [Granulicella pectinivorans]
MRTSYPEEVLEPAWNPDLTAWLTAAAAASGFDASGVAPAESPENAERFAAWIDQGRAGEMDWLKRRDEQGTLVRSSVRVAIPWARSVVVCAMNYNAAAPRSIDPADADQGWIARYAWSGSEGKPVDYHDDLLARLRTIEAGLQEKAPCQTRCYVDTGPLVERNAAVQAGIGWVGKNTCVIRQGIGSWMLVGVILTSLPLEETPALVADRCGSCTRCLDACPTHALVAPREMDASLCIAYLTIEKKGSIPETLREAIGRQLFGCDICQDVCPWNRKAPIAAKSGLETRSELVNPALDWLASLDSAGFRRLFRGSPLERTGKKRLHRNVAIAMGNSGDARFVPQLDIWSKAEDPVLAETAAWALGRLRTS